MRKILSSILMITTAAALIGLGTFAYFSDTETSGSTNSAKTGTIDIGVDWGTNGTISDLKPSQVRYLTETVTNVGRNPAIIYKHTHVDRTSDTPVVDPERKEGTVAGVYSPKSDIDKVILYDLKIIIRPPANSNEPPRELVIIPEPAGDENAPTLAQISSKWIKLGVLQPGWSMIVIQSYHMRKSTTNWAQDDSVGFTVDFKAVQTNDDTTFRQLTVPTGDPDFDLWLKQPNPPGSGDSFFDVFTELSLD